MTEFFDNSRHYIDIYNGDCVEVMDKLISDGITVDLTVTSPPYDDLRTYENKSSWNFDVFKKVADRLYKLTRDGGIVVWIVGDATVNGGETCSSYRQVLYFTDVLGFKLHDTMIYEKSSSPFPAPKGGKRYTQIFEFMFVFVKGKIRDDITLIADKKNKWAGFTHWGKHTNYTREGELIEVTPIKPIPETSLRTNIWKYLVGSVTGDDQTSHPAVFPERLAEDHILSWSCEGDIVFDPFLGSGTTGKMAILNNRKFIGSEISDNYFEIAKERILKYNDPVVDVTFVDGDNTPRKPAFDDSEEEKIELKVNELF